MPSVVALLWTFAFALGGRHQEEMPYCGALKSKHLETIEPLPRGFSSGMLQLLQLQVLIRHGARTPWANHRCWPGWGDGGKESWTCHMTNMLLPSARRDARIVPRPPVRRLFRKIYSRSAHSNDVEELAGDCEAGQLLSVGYEQQRLNGELLRRSYVRDGTVHQDFGAPRLFESADLRKLPPTERDFFLLRSDDMQRTIMSGQALFDAMFPHPKYYPGNPDSRAHHDAWIVPWHVRDKDVDTLAPNVLVCPRLNLAKYHALHSAEMQRLNNSQPIRTLTRQMQTALGVGFRWATVTDCLYTAHCNGRSLPPKLDRATFERALAWDARVHKTIYQHNNSYYSKLAMRPLFQEIWSELQKVVRGDADEAARRRFVLYSGHDSTLMPMLAALGVWDGEWSPYAAMLLLEVYKLFVPDPHSPSGWKHAFRLLYRGRALILPGCDTSVCDIDKLRLFIDSLNSLGSCKMTPHEVKWLAGANGAIEADVVHAGVRAKESSQSQNVVAAMATTAAEKAAAGFQPGTGSSETITGFTLATLLASIAGAFAVGATGASLFIRRMHRTGGRYMPVDDATHASSGRGPEFAMPIRQRSRDGVSDVEYHLGSQPRDDAVQYSSRIDAPQQHGSFESIRRNTKYYGDNGSSQANEI